MLKQLSHIVFKRYIALEYFNCPMSLHGLAAVATCGTLGYSLRTMDLTELSLSFEDKHFGEKSRAQCPIGYYYVKIV